MSKKNLLRSLIATIWGCSFLSHAVSSQLSVEELRLAKASENMPQVVSMFAENISNLERSWQQSRHYQEAKELVVKHAEQLWLDASTQIKNANVMDDRALYWARLSASKMLRTVKPQFTLTDIQLINLLGLLEKGTRGRTDLEYKQSTDKKILLTGFDPFLLDRNINQSNPSGIAALLLDGQVINYKGISAEINTVMIPVRYEDFDQGIIESLLAPYYALNNVDMVVTVSMGRESFDLERFPGKRRSVTFPDNQNQLSGGNQESPIVSKLHNRPLPGEEFVQFSLPVEQMMKASEPYNVNDNHTITSIAINNGEGAKAHTFAPHSLSQLNGHIAVSGSGGGYLSNEISYRSIRLRNELNSNIPTGHIHTPRIQQFDPKTEAKIIKQIKAMLEFALVAI